MKNKVLKDTKYITLFKNNTFIFFIVMIVKHWNRLLWYIMESPSAEVFKTWLDFVLGNLL